MEATKSSCLASSVHRMLFHTGFSKTEALAAISPKDVHFQIFLKNQKNLNSAQCTSTRCPMSLCGPRALLTELSWLCLCPSAYLLLTVAAACPPHPNPIQSGPVWQVVLCGMVQGALGAWLCEHPWRTWASLASLTALWPPASQNH